MGPSCEPAPLHSPSSRSRSTSSLTLPPPPPPPSPRRFQQPLALRPHPTARRGCEQLRVVLQHPLVPLFRLHHRQTQGKLRRQTPRPHRRRLHSRKLQLPL